MSESLINIYQISKVQYNCTFYLVILVLPFPDAAHHSRLQICQIVFALVVFAERDAASSSFATHQRGKYHGSQRQQSLII
jgi:hypothetical protein